MGFDAVRPAADADAVAIDVGQRAYALTAWILAQHNIIGDTERMDAQTLPQVKMPNRDAFRPGDPRPDVP